MCRGSGEQEWPSHPSEATYSHVNSGHGTNLSQAFFPLPTQFTSIVQIIWGMCKKNLGEN